MSKFEDRYLQILQASPYIKAFAKPGRQIASVRYYNYNGRIGAPGAQLDLNIPRVAAIETQADSDFIMTYISLGLLPAAGAALTFNRNVTVQILDLSTGKNFFSQPTIMGLVGGAGGFPYVLPAPRVVNPNTSLQITAVNRDTTVNYLSLFVAFHGTRVFYK